MRHANLLAKSLAASILLSSNAFTFNRINRCGSVQSHFATSTVTGVVDLPLDESSLDGQVEVEATLHRAEKSFSPMGQKIRGLMATGDIESAVQLLKELKPLELGKATKEDEEVHNIFLQELSDSGAEDAPDIAENVISSFVENYGSFPSSEMYNVVISIWSKSSRQEAVDICCSYLDFLWEQRNKTGDNKFVPFRSSYISTITALSKSRQRVGRENAEKAEALLEDLEERRTQYPQLAPNTIAVNAVLNAWSKSKLWYGSATRCEQILERMIKLCKDRPELKPDTTSFNSVIDTLAKSKERNREQRAENLLELMEELYTTDRSLLCCPDHVSFNAVINCWAQSKMTGAAHRATAILKHMMKRYDANNTIVAPDSASYTTVINAWARSRERDAIERAEEIFQLCEESFQRGNQRAKPNALTYNSLINCYSKFNDGHASKKAIELLETMKERSRTEEHEDCHPDVITYTSVMDALAKRQSVEAAAKAEALLEELENAHRNAPGDQRLKPNVRAYTSVINAIGRSGKNPEKAEAILSRIESMANNGDKAVAPDAVAYNAVINAYGWSDQKGKSSKCAGILRRMIEASDSGKNILATPDVITCNSILNACAFDQADTEEEHAEIMRIAIETLETFQRRIPKFGYPDHATFAQVLLAISRHMPQGDKRDEMAEATFWQCCRAGHVHSTVISSLQQALSWSLFSEVMASALKSGEGEKVVYDMSLFPRKWTRHAHQRFRTQSSKASRKRDRGFQVTKQTLSKRANKSRDAQ